MKRHQQENMFIKFLHKKNNSTYFSTCSKASEIQLCENSVRLAESASFLLILFSYLFYFTLVVYGLIWNIFVVYWRPYYYDIMNNNKLFLYLLLLEREDGDEYSVTGGEKPRRRAQSKQQRPQTAPFSP